MGQVLIVTSVQAEKEAVEAGIRGDSRFCVAVCGVGPYQAAVETTRLLQAVDYDAVINAGIAGGFDGRAGVGAVVFGTTAVAPELGAETADGGFVALDALGFGGATELAALAAPWVAAWRQGLAATRETLQAPILTVNTVTGTANSAAALAARYPSAAAEAMEGFAVATAAHAAGIGFLELRSISNRIGPRDRDSWRIPEALRALTDAFRVLADLPVDTGVDKP